MESFGRKRPFVFNADHHHAEKVTLAYFVEVLLCEILADEKHVRYPYPVESQACWRAVCGSPDQSIYFAPLSEVAVNDISDLLRETEEGHGDVV